jgi:putative ABC transport system permease protein
MRLGTLAWRGLLASRLRTSLAVVGIALGVAAVTGTIVVGSASEQALESATTSLLGRADVRLRAFADEGFGPRTVQAIRAQPGVVAAAPVSERRLTVSTAPGEDERVFTLLVLGIDPDVDATIRRPSLTEGIPLSADSPTDALVPASWAARNGREVGDTLLISGRREGLPGLRIVGLMDDTGLAALEGGNLIVVSRTTLDAALAAPSPIRYVDLDLGNAPTEEQIEAVEDTLTEPFVAETPADVAEQFASAQEGFVGVALLFGAVALVVGSFLVGNALAMTVGERTRELGLLRAAGTTSRQVLGIVVRQALVLGLLGSAVGVVAGIVLATVLIDFLATTRTVLVVGLPLPIGGLLAAFLLGLVVTMLGAVLPAIRAARLSPLDALRPPRRGDRGLSDRLRPLVLAELLVVLAGLALVAVLDVGAAIVPVALSLALLVGSAVAAAYVLEPLGRVIGRPFEWFFGAQGLLGRANLSRDRTRTGLTVGAMMIGLAAVVALGTVAESARAATDRRVASILPGGHAIRSGVPLDTDAFRASFEATPGLAVASPVLELPVVRVTAEGQEEAALAGIDPNVFADHDGLLITGTSRDDAFAALRDGGAVLVPEALAERADIEVGETLSLGVPGGPTQDLRVAGIVRYSLPARTDEGALLVSSADAREQFGATTASLWIMVPQADVAPSVFAAAVRETAVQLAAEPLTVRDLAGELSSTLDRLIGLFDVLALIAVVIGALGIVNTLAIGINERVREIAILRSQGMTVGQVQAMVVTEAAIMGAVAGVLALVAGLVVAVALVGGGASAELDAGVQLPWPLLIAVVLAGTGVAALAGLYPARVAASMPIVPSLKHFE